MVCSSKCCWSVVRLISFLGYATFNVSPGFRQGIGGVVEDFSNYVRHSYRF